MHSNYKFLLATLCAFINIAQAQPANWLSDNEKLCQKTLIQLIAQQQVIFSDTQVSPDIRRAAERAIDTSREVFIKNESYCEARKALQAYNPAKDTGFRCRDGEVNYFGREI